MLLQLLQNMMSAAAAAADVAAVDAVAMVAAGMHALVSVELWILIAHVEEVVKEVLLLAFIVLRLIVIF